MCIPSFNYDLLCPTQHLMKTAMEPSRLVNTILWRKNATLWTHLWEIWGFFWESCFPEGPLWVGGSLWETAGVSSFSVLLVVYVQWSFNLPTNNIDKKTLISSDITELLEFVALIEPTMSYTIEHIFQFHFERFCQFSLLPLAHWISAHNMWSTEKKQSLGRILHKSQSGTASSMPLSVKSNVVSVLQAALQALQQLVYTKHFKLCAAHSFASSQCPACPRLWLTGVKWKHGNPLSVCSHFCTKTFHGDSPHSHRSHIWLLQQSVFLSAVSIITPQSTDGWKRLSAYMEKTPESCQANYL